MLLLSKDDTLQSLLREVTSIRTQKEGGPLSRLKFELISAIFKHERVHVEHLGKADFRGMVRSGALVRTRDPKFIVAVNQVAEGRMRQLEMSTVTQVLLLNSLQEERVQLEVRRASVGLLKFVISQRMLPKLSFNEIYQVCLSLKGFAKNGFLRDSPDFLLKMIDELVAVTKSKLAVLLGSHRPGSLKYNVEMGKLSIVLSGLLSLNFQTEALTSFVLDFPEDHSPPSISLQRAEHLLRLEAGLQKKLEGARVPASSSKVPTFEALEAECELGGLKRKALSLHSKLTTVSPKSDIRNVLEIFKVLLKFEEKYGIQIGNSFKRVMCHKLARNSDQFSLKELVENTSLILDHVKASDQQLIKVLDRFAFSEFSDLVQLEYRAQLDLKQKNRGGGAGSSSPAAPAVYQNLKALGSSGDRRRALFRLNTLMANSMLILIIITARNKQHLSSISFSNALLSLEVVSADCLTVESAFLLRRVKQQHPQAAFELEAVEQLLSGHEKALDKADIEAVERVFGLAAEAIE